jgi:hypothetical protein
MNVFHVWATDTWTVPLDESEKLRVSKGNVVATFELYNFSMHESLITVTSSKTDPFIKYGNETGVLTLDFRTSNQLLPRSRRGGNTKLRFMQLESTCYWSTIS